MGYSGIGLRDSESESIRYFPDEAVKILSENNVANQNRIMLNYTSRAKNWSKNMESKSYDS